MHSTLDPQPHVLTSTKTSPDGRVRWAMLAAACLVMFGNYYAFDNPASLNKPLQDYMEMSDDSYAYFLNILYTSYSLPNIVLPWLGGYASDKFGHRRLLLSLSAMVAFGHFVVCLGVERKNVPAMILGRVLFGAGESLAVAQSALTVKYFRGKELAMALGINLCIARLGSVLNDILTPAIWARSTVPMAFWGGFLSCVMSFLMACVLVALDQRFGSDQNSNTAGFSRLPTHHSDTRFSIEALDLSSSDSDSQERYDPPTSGKARLSFSSREDIGLEVMRKQKSPKVVKAGSSRFKNAQATHQRLNTETTTADHSSPSNQIEQVSDGEESGDNKDQAAQIMTVPDLLSAILVLPVGYFVDHYGKKSWLFMLCGLVIGGSHTVLGLAPISTPVPALMALGISSAIGAIFTSAIPVLVRGRQIATAYGISTSAMNLAFTVFPLIVAKLMTVDPNVYTYVEIFFALCGYLGFLLAVRLRWLDTYGDLDRREIDNKIVD
ncbi:hypothetical protein BGZ83_005995 [Gryganskiella cystojenkinii]|nr:hypothetical protein BGZ83_005995 [Gryganskiella cystojenkinii]